MAKKRIERLNSLLKEVISEVILKDVRNPKLAKFISVTQVDLSNDMQHAKVFISVLGTEQEKTATIEALESAAGFIAISASKKVVMRYFPQLTFKLDDSVEKHLRIASLLDKIHHEQEIRKPTLSPDSEI